MATPNQIRARKENLKKAKPFKKGDPRINKKGGHIVNQRLKEAYGLLDDKGYQPIKPKDVAIELFTISTFTKPVVRKLAKDESLPIYINIIAQSYLDKKVGFERFMRVLEMHLPKRIDVTSGGEKIIPLIINAKPLREAKNRVDHVRVVDVNEGGTPPLENLTEKGYIGNKYIEGDEVEGGGGVSEEKGAKGKSQKNKSKKGKKVGKKGAKSKIDSAIDERKAREKLEKWRREEKGVRRVVKGELVTSLY